MIEFAHKNITVREQCRLLEVNRSTLYYVPKPTPDEGVLLNLISDIWMKTPFYGYRRIWAELRHQGHEVNRKRVQRLMKEMNLQAIYPKKNLSKANLLDQKYPYLLRDLVINRPNMVWCTDITYIKMAQGFVYLVAIIDVYSRYIISWRLSTNMEQEFCLEMLEEALSKATPDYINTDQGSQFTGQKWIDLVEASGAKVSMDGKGRWADNIPIERFWKSVKYEGVLLYAYKTVPQARQSLEHYIRFYNEDRPHQSLGYARPADVYCQDRAVAAFRFKKVS
jgi:putative transposase